MFESYITKTKRYSKDKSFKDFYYINIHKLSDVYKFYNFCYKDAKYFLKRKYLKFGPLVEKFTKLVTVNSGKEDSELTIPSQASLLEGVETLHGIPKT